MSTPSSQENQAPGQEQALSNKELNFRALEQKYQKQLEQERNARLEAERMVQESKQRQVVEEDDDSEPYVDHKKLNKTISKLGQSTQTEIAKAMELAKHSAKEELKQEMWLENNPDFYEVLNHAEKFAQKSPRLAASILRMPEGFERQKLVYENIKELGLDKPDKKESSIQDKINANRKSPYYQPSGVGTAPYASASDFSEQGKKQAYEKMNDLKKRYGM